MLPLCAGADSSDDDGIREAISARLEQLAARASGSNSTAHRPSTLNVIRSARTALVFGQSSAGHRVSAAPSVPTRVATAQSSEHGRPRSTSATTASKITVPAAAHRVTASGAKPGAVVPPPLPASSMRTAGPGMLSNSQLLWPGLSVDVFDVLCYRSCPGFV